MIAQAIRAKKRAVIPYVTAGLPDLDATGDIIAGLSRAGAAAIEIGIPFSDPMADGPVLQKASHRALQAGFTLDGLFSRLGGWSASSEAPLVVMSYINPLMRRGLAETMKRLRTGGIEGVIIPDLPLDGAEIFKMCRDTGIDLIRLVAPTTPPERQREVVSQCSGFVYAVTVKGVTGARASLPSEVRQQVVDLKAMTDLPVCVGFGVSEATQVTGLLGFADGVIVGSHLMAKVMDSTDPVRAVQEAFTALCSEP
jgi:tryptophan synthase alpha chain